MTPQQQLEGVRYFLDAAANELHIARGRLERLIAQQPAPELDALHEAIQDALQQLTRAIGAIQPILDAWGVPKSAP